MTHSEMMLDFCKRAHEHKDMLMSKMAEAVHDKTIKITDQDLLTYIALRGICEDNVMEMQRKYVWQPLNAKVGEADGIYTVHVDGTSHFMRDLAGHDLNKAMAHLLRHMDSVKMSDPSKYEALMAEIKG